MNADGSYIHYILLAAHAVRSGGEEKMYINILFCIQTVITVTVVIWLANYHYPKFYDCHRPSNNRKPIVSQPIGYINEHTATVITQHSHFTFAKTQFAGKHRSKSEPDASGLCDR